MDVRRLEGGMNLVFERIHDLGVLEDGVMWLALEPLRSSQEVVVVAPFQLA